MLQTNILCNSILYVDDLFKKRIDNNKIYVVI